MRIQHNIMAMNAYRNYNTNTSALSKNLEKLSSGYKINRAGDDAAGLAISEKMRAQITGLEGAQSNAKDGISLVQTAEGALTEVHDMLNRMYELAEQSANGTYENEVDRVQLQKEVSNLTAEINRIADSSNFNGIKLLNGELGTAYTAPNSTAIALTTTGTASKAAVFTLDLAGLSGFKGDGVMSVTIDSKTYDVSVTAGMTASSFAADLVTAINADKVTGTQGGAYTAAAGSGAKITLTSTNQTATTELNGTFTLTAKSGMGGLSLQIGDTGEDFNQLTVSIKDCHASSMGTEGGASIADVNISTQEGAKTALQTIKDAINYVSDVRGGLGAIQNRLDHTINNLSVMQENIQDAESSIRDTDIADEMMDYTKNNILIQSAQAMLAQANQVPQGVLQLLQ